MPQYTSWQPHAHPQGQNQVVARCTDRLLLPATNAGVLTLEHELADRSPFELLGQLWQIFSLPPALRHLGQCRATIILRLLGEDIAGGGWNG